MLRDGLGQRVPACCQNYLDGSDSAIDERERLQTFETTDDLHVSEILKDELDALYLVQLLPNVVLKAVHALLSDKTLTTISNKEESDFFAPCFTYFYYFPPYISI